MSNSNVKLSLGEKIGYSLGDLSANLVFQTLVTYLAYFYTDIYGLKNNDASLIILIVGLSAAFLFNPIIGALADRTRSRWGKFRPWVLYTSIPLGVIALLAFTTPDFSYKGKVIYAAATYTLLLLFYAGNNLPYAALSGVLTGNMAERNSLSSYRFVAVMFAQFFVQVFMLPIIMYAGDGDKAAGIETVMTWLAIIGTVMLIITFLTTRERVVPTADQESTLKEDLSDLVKNKPWLIMLISTILVFVTLALKGGSYVYYFENYVDKGELQSFIQPFLNFLSRVGLNFFGSDLSSAGFGLFNAGGIIFSMVGIAVSTSLANKFGKRDVFRAALFIATLFILVFIFFKPTDVKLIFGSQILHMFFYGVTTPLLWAMIADVADFSEWKTNRRATAIIFSAMMVGLKSGLSIGSALVTWILGLYGYVHVDNVAVTEVVQPETVATGSKMLVSVYASIPFFLVIILLFFYEISKSKEVEIEQALVERRKKNTEE